MSAPAGPPPPGPPPAVPDGWQVNWSDQYHQWFYVQQATGASQWQHPSGPVQPAAPPPQPVYYPPPQPQYNQQHYGQPENIPNQYSQLSFAPPPTTAQPATPGAGGIMGKLTSLDPKAQMALAAGGGLAAGALLEHEIDGFHRPHYGHHGSHNHMLGTMAGLMGAAGAGALGAKFFGGKNQAVQAPPQPVAAAAPYPAQALGGQTYPAQATAAPPPPYPGQQPPQPGAPGSALGLGKFAVGGAAIGAAGALAASGVSNLMHHHQDQGGAPPPISAAGGGGGMGSLLGGLAHSGGPRLIIHAAAYADKDVTDVVRSRVSPDQVLTIEKLSDDFGDPWPEAERKMFSVLYQYGDRPMEVWAGSTSTGKVDIRNEALANVRMSYINKDHGHIVCLIWGDQSVLSKERVEKLEKDGELDCSGLGDGGFYPWQARALICYYTDDHGDFAVGHGREGGTMRLPWNPLAKWS